MALKEKDKQHISELIIEQCTQAESTAKNLLHAPEACCIIETIAVLASCTKDPSLRSGEKDEKFLFLRTPESFKASLYQVINSMCEAFRVANNSMDKIHLSLNTMPATMIDMLEALDDYDEPDSKQIISHSLSNITRSANICVKAAKDADDECKKALNVIQELLQAAIATQGRSEHRTEAAQLEMQEQKHFQEQKQRQLKALEEQIKEQENIVHEAREDYKLRMGQSTDFTGVFGAMFVDNFNNLVQSVLKSAENLSGGLGNLPVSVLTVLKNASNDSNTFMKKEDMIGLAIESTLLECMEDIVKQNNEDVTAQAEGHIKNLKYANTYKTVSEMGKMLRKGSKLLIEGLESIQKNEPDCQKKFENAKTAASFNMKAYEKAHNSEEVNEDIFKTMTSEERQTFMRIRNENLKVSRETLASERQRQDELRKEQTATDEQLCEIMANLERLKLEEVDLKDVVKYLRQGIQQLSRVQIAWKNIVAFFNQIRNTVEGPMIEHIHSVTTHVEEATDGSMSSLKRRILLREVTKACAVANVLMQSAQLYKEISKEYVMPIIDKSIVNIGLTQPEAQALQYNIVTNFNKVRECVESKIDFHNENLTNNVRAKMIKQGFNVGRAIEDKKVNERRLFLE